jgi:hypothetical protein
VRAEKPHKGIIKNWRKHPLSPGFGAYVVIGSYGDRDEFFIRTSPVVSHDEATGEIETRNSRYTLV